MKRYRWPEIVAGVIVPATALAAMIAACVTDRADPVICSTGLACAPGWQCAGDGQSCHPASCGDTNIDRAKGELCDDGNTRSGDGCSASCLILESCGDGKIDHGEVCDPGATPSETKCSMNCQSTLVCGNGIVDEGEDCDDGEDGNRRATATCDEDCTEPVCGDGVFNPQFVNPATDLPEACDDGTNTSMCDADCTLVVCGDGLHNAAAEECDDANTDDTDGCVDQCKQAGCGDGHQWKDVEDCETTTDTKDCDADDCLIPVCGDGYRNDAAGEDCDDGNTLLFDDCVQCQQAICGDGFVRLGEEECDDGNNSNGDHCPDDPNPPTAGTCERARCGDGFIQIGKEDCDTTADSPLCDRDCTRVECGDGHLNRAANEACESNLDCLVGGRCLRNEETSLCQCV
jgi:cysteine-rich repeat protein